MDRIEVNLETGETTVVTLTSEEEAAAIAYAASLPVPVPASITRPQAARRLLDMALVTGAEALAMAQTGTPPAFVMTQINALPTEQQIPAQIDFARYEYDRANPLLIAMTLANGNSSADVDQFFRDAAAL